MRDGGCDGREESLGIEDVLREKGLRVRDLKIGDEEDVGV